MPRLAVAWAVFHFASALLPQRRACVPRHRVSRCAVTEGHDAEADAVGPGIYGGRVVVDTGGCVVIGQQFEEHNPIPGPVYAGGGYTAVALAVRAGDAEALHALIANDPGAARNVATGGATPLHLTGMLRRAAPAAQILIEAGAEIDARDAWGYTPLQRCATNNCLDAAQALLAAGANPTAPSGLENAGDSAHALAKRLRSYDVIFAIDTFLAEATGTIKQ
ncbi:hypothetical protein M885DRAFT_510939 [Pelagophyceae sp. CCMP2097]|nr:hypothetical protein M885DRAFT_510939 [Pelagophyceae sp. CCMP2097]